MLDRPRLARIRVLLPALLLWACAAPGAMRSQPGPAPGSGEPVTGATSSTPPPIETAVSPRPWSVYASVQAFHWREEYRDRELLEEEGPLFGLGVDFRRRWFRSRLELFGGTVEYDGETQGGDPVETDTNYLGGLGEFDFFVLTGLRDDPPTLGRFYVDPYLGLGMRYWARDIEDRDDARGYREDWFTAYIHAGADVVAPLRGDGRWYAGARFGYSLYNYESVDEFDVELNPGRGPRVRVETGLDWESLKAAVFFEWVRFAKSDEEDGYFQPESTMAILGLNVGFRW